MRTKPYEDVAILALRLKRFADLAEAISVGWQRSKPSDSEALLDLVIQIEATIADVREHYF